MKKPNPILVIFGALVFAGAVAAILFFGRSAQNQRLHVQSPSGDWGVFGLPFQGSKPNPLDSKLRLFLQDKQGNVIDKHQTTLPVNRKTRIEWIADPPRIVIHNGRDRVMVWSVDGSTMVCLEGHSFLAPDPEPSPPISQ